MSKDNGHRLYIELCHGVPILDEAIKHIAVYGDANKRLQEMFRMCVVAGCVMDDAQSLNQTSVDEVSKALNAIAMSASDSRVSFRFRLYNDDNDWIFPGFSGRYLKLSRNHKRMYVTRMYLLGFWFFTRFSNESTALIADACRSHKVPADTQSDNDEATIIERNDEAVDLLGGLDICL